MSIFGLEETATKNAKSAKGAKKHDKVCKPAGVDANSADAKKVLKQIKENGKDGDCAFC